jgi:hypothetical protein
VAVEVFDNLVFAQFGIHLNEQEKDWFAVDGKELRGSIESGEKRGEAVVQVVGHTNRSKPSGKIIIQERRNQKCRLSARY